MREETKEGGDGVKMRLVREEEQEEGVGGRRDGREGLVG